MRSLNAFKNLILRVLRIIDLLVQLQKLKAINVFKLYLNNVQLTKSKIYQQNLSFWNINLFNLYHFKMNYNKIFPKPDNKQY